MIVIGLTGGIGSGKSTVADLFAARGAALVDTDQIAHELTAAGGHAMPAIAARFGPGVLRPDGGLDRPAMRRLAFSDPAAREQLEAILHPAIRDEADRRCQAAQAPYILLVVPLLVESGHYRTRCQRILVVDCPESVQEARVMARSGLSRAEVRAIIAAQAPRAARLAIADDVIDNAGDPAALPPRIAELDTRYRGLALTDVKANC